MSAEEARAEAIRLVTGLVYGDNNYPDRDLSLATKIVDALAEWQASREVTDAEMEAAEFRVREFLDMYEERYGEDSIIASTHFGGDARNRGVSLETTDLRALLATEAAREVRS